MLDPKQDDFEVYKIKLKKGAWLEYMKIPSIDVMMNWFINRISKNHKTFVFYRKQDGLDIYKLKSKGVWHKYVRIPFEDILEYQKTYNRGIEQLPLKV